MLSRMRLNPSQETEWQDSGTQLLLLERERKADAKVVESLREHARRHQEGDAPPDPALPPTPPHSPQPSPVQAT